MRPRRDIAPHMGNSDSSNASLTLLKLYKRIRTIDPTYQPPSKYQSQRKCTKALRLVQLRIVK